MIDKRGILKRTVVAGGLIILAGVLVYHVLSGQKSNQLPEGFTEGNGRIEATEVDIATKLPGRVDAVLVREGDFVDKDQILARMETTPLDAQLREAEADVVRMKDARQTAVYKAQGVHLRLKLAIKELDRLKSLLAKGSATQQQYDNAQTNKQALDAEYLAAKSSIAEIDAARAAAIAKADKVKANLNDCILKTPIKGAVLTRLVEPGEVLPAGGKVLTIIDPTDIYMNIYVSEYIAGIIPHNADAKVVLDAIPNKAFPAKVTYVSAKAQFTPKEVEAAEERQKLVFRAKVRLTQCNDPRLKPGMPGVAYIRFKPNAKWPPILN